MFVGGRRIVMPMLSTWALCLGALITAPSPRTFVPEREPAVIIDLRSRAEYAERHLSGASSIPLASLAERLYTLPPPAEWPLELVGSRAELADACDFLRPRGWDPILRDAAEPSTWARTPTERGDTSAPSWRPNSFLHAAMREARPDVDGPAAALDLGCGSGRDAVFIGDALGPAWSVYGIDNHAAALNRARALAAEARANDNNVEFLELDLRKRGIVLPDNAPPVGLVHGCRFLSAPLLAAIPSLLAPGGLVVWSTFADGADGRASAAPPHRRSRRLERGQMRAALGEVAGFDVLYDGEGELLTRGVWVPAQFFCARRR